jgi:hypothetical protein
VGDLAVVGDAASGTGRAEQAGRLELARELLRSMEDRSAGVRPAAVASGPDDRVVPVAGPLAGVLPAGGLRRGSTVSLPGAPGAGSLLLALLAAVSESGAWSGVVGRPGLGLVAAAEAGVRLERLALVPRPGAELIAVTVALLDGMDVVAVADPARGGVRAADRQRLAARARQRGAVLLALGAWPGADLELTCTHFRWRGVGAGAGRLHARQVGLRVCGRGVAPGGRTARLVLPAPDVPTPDPTALPAERQGGWGERPHPALVPEQVAG